MRDILVHVDRSSRVQSRIETAIGLARRTGARLTGLFAQSDNSRMAAVARRPSDHLRQAMAEAEAAFTQATEAAGVPSSWRALPHGEPDFVVAEFAFCARYFDLVVMGQTDTDDAVVPTEMVEQTVLNGGRPILTVPRFGAYPEVARRVVVAWNASREAARALHDSLPLLKLADTVTVLTVFQGDGSNAANLPSMDVMEHLRGHGVNVEGERLPDEAIGKMEMLLSRSCDLGADLLVMGAYGHYGLARLRGSATRHMLKHMTLPILLSN